MDPVKEWQRLSRVYAEKSDAELSELCQDFGDLTDIAQQVLRDELKRRALPEPEAVVSPATSVNGKSSGAAAGKRDYKFSGSITNPILAEGEEEGGGNSPADYSWKVVLCECSEREEAADVMTALDQAGIKSWYDGRDGATAWATYSPRVLVAADDLEQAQLVMQNPISQEIRDQNRTKVPDFETPYCSKCGAADPVLESAEPANVWRCEECGAQWNDPISEAQTSSEKAEE